MDIVYKINHITYVVESNEIWIDITQVGVSGDVMEDLTIVIPKIDGFRKHQIINTIISMSKKDIPRTKMLELFNTYEITPRYEHPKNISQSSLNKLWNGIKRIF